MNPTNELDLNRWFAMKFSLCFILLLLVLVSIQYSYISIMFDIDYLNTNESTTLSTEAVSTFAAVIICNYGIRYKIYQSWN